MTLTPFSLPHSLKDRLTITGPVPNQMEGTVGGKSFRAATFHRPIKAFDLHDMISRCANTDYPFLKDRVLKL